MKIKATATYRGQCGEIARGQEFDAPETYAKDLIRSGLAVAVEDVEGKAKRAAPENKDAAQRAPARSVK